MKQKIFGKYMSLNGSEIKHARLRLGLTQNQMARYMGMTQLAVASIELRIGGREETDRHLAHLQALLLLGRHGLLAELATELLNET